MSHRDDQSLVAACRAGDESAWSDLVDRYGRLVYSIPRRYGMSDADCDDVLQSVFTIAFRRLDSLADAGRLSAWLITTTHRECWRTGKRTRPGADHEFDRHFESVDEPPESTVLELEQRHLVRRALTELGGGCERLLTALFLSGADRDYEQIARDLDMKVGSIGPTRARCFKKLEPILARLGVAPEADSDAVPGR